MDAIDFMEKNIIRNMTEGVMTISGNGTIMTVNPACETILGRNAKLLVGQKFASAFFEDEKNDAFNQFILDAIYDPDSVKDGFVSYQRENSVLQLRVITSLLVEEGQRQGIIVVLSDMSELLELRDAVKAMNEIRRLNGQLEKRNEILSKTFGRFLSDEIVEELLATPEGLMLGGKKRNLTILMSDLRGFTALSEVMDSADLLAMLNHYLGEMTKIIQEHHGTIIEFIGDGILAIFGAPHYFENHGIEAVAAGVCMQREMDEINRWNVKNGFPKLQMGIGINTGDVIIGNIGSSERTKYGVTGREVNLCGRIESFTVKGELLISENTKLAAGDDLIIEEVRSVVPKGAKEPMNLYKVIGIGGMYQISCALEEDVLQSLSEPIRIRFYKLAEKSVLTDEYHGTIVSVGENTGHLITDSCLNRYDNLMIAQQGDNYCKVIRKLENGYLISFTALSEQFEQMITDKKKGS